MKINRKLYALPVMTAAALLAAACSGGSSNSGSAITIRAILPPNTGPISSPQNASLQKFTQEYESNHPNVSVEWQPNPVSSITTANATLVSQSSGGDAPDIVWQQYNPLLSGSIPSGILQNLKPYLEKPNPYVSGNTKWLDLFTPATIPYMTSPNGQMQILLGSNVETAFFYSKAAFSKAGISGTPADWAGLMSDMAKLKQSGVTPFMFADGGPCNPSWYERLASTSLLTPELSKFVVDKSQVTSGLDDAVGVTRNILSMNNPRYAEVWKLLGSMRPYMAKGGSSYDACSTPSTVSPPLSPQSLLVQGKVAMLWGGSWFIPQLNSAGFTGKYGLFAEPPITQATTPYATGVSTKGVIGGPNGDGQWSITSQKADHSMTPAKTKTVMNFMAWLFTPQHIGPEVKDWGQGGADIPTVKGASVPNVPGLASLVPAKAPPIVVDIALDDVLSTNTTNTGLRFLSSYLSGGTSYSAFASQWDQNLQAGAQAYAKQNNVNLAKYK
jgi:ABC-type glycerol-3-phosphate transport system substrate-binding protein